MARVQDIDRGWDGIKAKLRRVSNVGLVVGLFGGRIPGGGGPTLAEIGFWNEFGTPTIPARPFMRTAFDQNVAAYKRDVDKIQAAVMSPLSGDPFPAIQTLGQNHLADVKLTITRSRSWAVKNAQATIDRKGSATPLIHTAAMRRAVTFKLLVGGALNRLRSGME